MSNFISSWLKNNGLDVDSLLRSSLTILVFFALVGCALWFFFRGKFKPLFFLGFGAGALYLLWVNANNNKQDKSANPDAVSLSGAVDVSGGVTKGFTYADVLAAQANGTI